MKAEASSVGSWRRALRWIPAGLTAVLLLLASAPGGGVAVAQSIISGGIVQEIRIEGTQRVDPQTVRTYMTLDPGDPFDPVVLDESLKRIYASGLFADVTFRREGDTLVITVVENPVINRIAFEGNQRIDDATLEQEVELRPRVVFTRTRVQNDVQRILDIYRRSGRFAATVEPKVIRLDQNRVDLVFEIDEGELTSVDSINFIGNEAFSDGTLRGEILTRESAWWRFLTTTDTYDPDRLAFERDQLLGRFYRSEGYADFRVISAVAELRPDNTGFIITFTVEEGPRYHFGKIGITSSLRELDPEQLRSELETEEGDWYDASAVEKSVEQLTAAVGNLGYAFVDVRPRVERDRENLTINLTYEIQEGPKVYVERIDIQGNVRTLDKVIRREFRLVEGDAFNAAKLRRSRQRIENLGFFHSVEVANQPGSTSDRTVITVKVEEQSTGDVTFGAGLSTGVGVIGNIQLRERNLLGRGQDLRLGLTLSGESSQVDLSFTEPYFLDRNISAGFDLFRTTRQQEESGFDQERLGGSLRAGYNLTEHTRQVFRYTIENRTIENLADDASLLLRSEEGETLRSSFIHDLSWDRRDRRFDPSEGFIISTTNQFTGVGGDVHYLKNSLEGTYYFPLSERVTLSFGAEAGLINGLGEDTRISDRFFLGLDSFRGFERGGVGPRDVASNDAVGGKQYYKGTVELKFPLGLPEEFDIRGRLFMDVGAVWGVDGDDSGIVDSSSPRLSVGPGFSWNSPFGPINLDLGYAFIKEDFDQTQILSFSFGTQF